MQTYRLRREAYGLSRVTLTPGNAGDSTTALESLFLLSRTRLLRTCSDTFKIGVAPLPSLNAH